MCGVATNELETLVGFCDSSPRSLSQILSQRLRVDLNALVSPLAIKLNRLELIQGRRGRWSGHLLMTPLPHHSGKPTLSAKYHGNWQGPYECENDFDLKLPSCTSLSSFLLFHIHYYKLADETVVVEVTTSLAIGITKLLEVQFPALEGHGVELRDAKGLDTTTLSEPLNISNHALSVICGDFVSMLHADSCEVSEHHLSRDLTCIWDSHQWSGRFLGIIGYMLTSFWWNWGILSYKFLENDR